MFSWVTNKPKKQNLPYKNEWELSSQKKDPL